MSRERLVAFRFETDEIECRRDLHVANEAMVPADLARFLQSPLARFRFPVLASHRAPHNAVPWTLRCQKCCAHLRDPDLQSFLYSVHRSIVVEEVGQLGSIPCRGVLPRIDER